MQTLTRWALSSFLTLMMLGLFTGSSCDNGTQPKTAESIVDTWQMTQVVMKDTPVGDLTFTAAQFLGMSGTGAATSTLRFNADGTASLTTTYTEGDDVVVPGTWSTNGDKLTLDGAGIDDTVPYDIDRDTLTLTVTMPIDFAGDGTAEDTEIDMIYTKV